MKHSASSTKMPEYQSAFSVRVSQVPTCLGCPSSVSAYPSILRGLRAIADRMPARVPAEFLQSAYSVLKWDKNLNLCLPD